MKKPTQRVSRRHKNVLLGEKTRLEILRVAEELFADLGPAAVSIRLIAKTAKVNLAAVNYHFGTKETLLQEVFKRRVVPLNERRKVLLDACAAAATGRRPVLEDAIRAMVEPAVQLYAEAGPSARAILIMQFLHRALGQAAEADPLEPYYGPVRRRFIDLVRRALPTLNDVDLVWRVNFLTGVLLYTMLGPSQMRVASARRAALPSPLLRSAAEAREQIVAYVAAGFRAPSVSEAAWRTHAVGTQHGPPAVSARAHSTRPNRHVSARRNG